MCFSPPKYRIDYIPDGWFGKNAASEKRDAAHLHRVGRITGD